MTYKGCGRKRFGVLGRGGVGRGEVGEKLGGVGRGEVGEKLGGVGRGGERWRVGGELLQSPLSLT